MEFRFTFAFFDLKTSKLFLNVANGMHFVLCVFKVNRSAYN